MLAEAVEEGLAATARVPVERDEQRDEREAPERETVTEAEHQGSVLSQVRPSTTSARSRNSPNSSGMWKRSP